MQKGLTEAQFRREVGQAARLEIHSARPKRQLTGELPDILGSRDSLFDASILREHTMNAKAKKNQIADSLRNLVTAYSKALAHLEDALAVLCKELELGEIEIFHDRLLTLQAPAHDPEDAARPIADRSLLSVRWRGKSCFLGNTFGSDAAGECHYQ